MGITFKRINDNPEYYYELIIDELSDCSGNFEVEYEGHQLSGVAIKLHKFWCSNRDYKYTNAMGELYINLSTFESEFYPVVLGKDIPLGKVEKYIERAKSDIIDDQYKNPIKNEILDEFSKTMNPDIEVGTVPCSEEINESAQVPS